MKAKYFPVIWYAVRWASWAFTYTVVWPAAAIALLAMMILTMQSATPGELMAREIASVTRQAGPGEYRISDCSGSDVPNPRAVCRETITDARGYAAYIDRSVDMLPLLWMALAAWFALMGLIYRPTYNPKEGPRSLFYRYGRRTPQGEHHEP
ncbi:hypothetical protein NKZ99_004244 [Salmonella enterica]|nr:hypothetical protein [Salmonella enterica]